MRFPAGKEVHFWDLKRDRGIAWYLSLFPAADPGVVQGEITPAYAILAADQVAEVREHAPQVRLLFVMRDPVERAWSSALMALGRAEMEPQEASDQWFLDHFRSRGSLARGDYASCLNAWLTHFSPEALLLLRFEDISSAPERVLIDTCRHLGLDPAPLLEGSNPWLRRRVFESEQIPLPGRLRAALEEIYSQPLRRLREEYGITWPRRVESATR